MLAIRMKRIGRSGHAQFRVIVQDSRYSPASGRIVAYVGSYNPHTKAASLDGHKISSYLDNGAQPSDRVVALLKKEGLKLPKWVKTVAPKKRVIKHPEKLKKNRPPEAKTAPAPAEPTAGTVDAEPPTQSPAKDVSAEESKAEPEVTAVKPDETPAAEAEVPKDEEAAPAAEPEKAQTEADEPKD